VSLVDRRAASTTAALHNMGDQSPPTMDKRGSYRPRSDPSRVNSKKKISSEVNDTKVKDEKKESTQQQSATLSELFSLSDAKPRTRTFLVVGLISSFVSGCVYPAMAFFL